MMTPFTCPRCHLTIDQTDNYCRHCGRNLHPGRGFFHSHIGIILLSIVLGPFALPWVWTSHRIGMVAKICYTAILGLLGIMLVQLCIGVYQLTLNTTQLLLGGF